MIADEYHNNKVICDNLDCPFFEKKNLVIGVKGNYS